MKKIPISELFYSLQGEGKWTGTPALFVRVWGCNLRCPQLPCDTPYSLPPSKPHRLMEVEAIWEWSLPFLSKKPILVLTGGEPLLYSHLLYRLVQLYPFPVVVETNGTIAPDFLRQPLWRRAEFVLSIKLSNSGEPAERRIKPSIIAQIGKLAPASYFKFVVNPFRLEEQREEIEEIRKYAPHLPVYLMPQGATLSQLEEGSSRVAQFALRYGYRYSDRLQLRLGLK